MIFSDDDLKPAINESLNRVKPMIQKDGGDIELVKIENGTIYVKLKGACVGCSSSNQTIQNLVEKDMKTYIHPELKVVNLSK